MKIYNTMTRQKEEFVPVEPGKVKMYSCGPTVYNYFHIGNARPFLFFDVVKRYFNYIGYDVTYVQNITDIDDKIINQANDEKVSYTAVTEKYIRAFFEDIKALGIKGADIQPKATDVIQEIIDFIAKLIELDAAYEVNGDVYFSVESASHYGSLSGRKLEDMQAGARVETNEQKRNSFDFTLWKKAKPGEPEWDSPWGKGRPGWHTECVVMSCSNLGETFDIHGGGVDLIFPHHENELAQAWAVNKKPLCNYWVHNGFINIEGEKMSKSLNNFFTLRDILKEYDAETVRYFFLSKHYRSPIDYNTGILDESAKAVQNFYNALEAVDYLKTKEDKVVYPVEFTKYTEAFIEAMDDDFNTAKALAVLFEINKLISNQENSNELRVSASHLLVELGTVLGFFSDIDKKLKSGFSDISESLINLLITYRNEAKTRRDWTLADKIRDDLLALGVQLLDTKEGTVHKLLK
ncbi:MAG: cysteine--tRNA ligase [Candidatus Cloacimonetes bacterium]|nr:cysteine--tRNA ligase [Candidatus Cloacimonadota bacterium]